MKLRFRFKMNAVTSNQRGFLKQCFGNCRFVYNHFLAEVKEKRETDSEYFFNYNEAAKQLTQMKTEEDKQWLFNSPNECLQQSLRNLSTAFSNMKKSGSGFPRFKSKYKHDYTASFTHGLIDFENWTLKLPSFKIPFKLARNYRHSRLDFKSLRQGTITVEMTPSGEFFCSVVLEVPDGFCQRPVDLSQVVEDEVLGGDLGLKDFITLSDGKRIDNFNKSIRKIKSLEKTIEHMQKAYARKKSESKRKERMRMRIARLHNKIKNIRVHMLTQIAIEMASDDRYKVYVLEDLNIKGMMKNHHLAHAIASVSWNSFIDILNWQCRKRGKLVFHIDRFFPSSKTYSDCGSVNRDLELKDRFWICPDYDAVIDRDLNAAVNIRDEFIRNHLDNEIKKQHVAS